MDISPISSSSSVPWSAISNRPRFPLASAPEKAPFSYPKSSDSSRFAEIAAQLTFTNGLSLRLLNWWISSATTSLPAPDSPVSKIVADVGAARFTSKCTCCMAGEFHINRSFGCASDARMIFTLSTAEYRFTASTNCAYSSFSCTSVWSVREVTTMFLMLPCSSKIGTPTV